MLILKKTTKNIHFYRSWMQSIHTFYNIHSVQTERNPSIHICNVVHVNTYRWHTVCICIEYISIQVLCYCVVCTQLYSFLLTLRTQYVKYVHILYNINHNNHIGWVPACHWFLGLVACCYCTHKTYSSISGKGGTGHFL